MENIFERKEMKYILNEVQYWNLKKHMAEYMQLDKYGKNRVQSVYLDTEDCLLIRRSIEKPTYKEKLRIRGYGDLKKDGKVFVELKKKYKGIVYKRRMEMPEQDAVSYIATKKSPLDSQISHEVDYFLNFYGNLSPRMILCVEREAYFDRAGSDFRMTFDSNVLARDYDFDMKKQAYGTPILEEGQYLLEIKTSTGLPDWILDFFKENGIYKTSFSKYGVAYRKILFPKIIGYGGEHSA